MIGVLTVCGFNVCMKTDGAGNIMNCKIFKEGLPGEPTAGVS